MVLVSPTIRERALQCRPRDAAQQADLRARRCRAWWSRREAGKGGTWAGATSSSALIGSPVYVRQSGRASEGLDALRRQGARAWPEPMDQGSLESLLNQDVGSRGACRCAGGARPVSGGWIASRAREEVISRDVGPLLRKPGSLTPADRLWDAIRPVLSDLLAEPHDEAAVADLLQVSKAQARAWMTG